MGLFIEYEIKGHKIKNRIVMPPLVCFGFSDDTGYVTERHVKHYEERAKGGTGLIIVEATCIEKNGRLSTTQLGIWNDNHIEGLKKITEACHNHKAKVLLQIHHAGLKAPEAVTSFTVAPSEYNNNGRYAKALSLSEIKQTQQHYVEAAIRAQKSGFDGIELHGAHGYLISQFVSPLINKREDFYGGTVKKRVNFAKEIIQNIREAVSKDFIIGYRMGGNEPTICNGIEIAKLLENYGVDLLHVSSGNWSEETPEAPKDFNYNWIVYCGTEIKKNVKIPVIVVNGIRTPEQAKYIVDKNMADFVAVGKGLLADPYWAEKAETNKQINHCRECNRCFWYSNGDKCPWNISK